ncbi:MAG: hypothetical protein HBSAPP02_17540 [Phycisphaerae bacterium]|nr:MAG: hypothetical protein HBSAPP02_17540 [Phycisphaerae bacterium]
MASRARFRGAREKNANSVDGGYVTRYHSVVRFYFRSGVMVFIRRGAVLHVAPSGEAAAHSRLIA